MKNIFVPLAVAGVLLSYAPATSAASPLGDLSENIGVGRTLSVGLNVSSTGPWRIGRNTAPAIAKAVITPEGAQITGLKTGTTAIDICTGALGNCMRVNLTVGNVLGQSSAAHRVGSWVLQGQTVFYVHQEGLIPIPTWNIFLSVGGKADSIITANEADLQLPLLPLMEMSDSRLK